MAAQKTDFTVPLFSLKPTRLPLRDERATCHRIIILNHSYYGHARPASAASAGTVYGTGLITAVAAWAGGRDPVDPVAAGKL